MPVAQHYSPKVSGLIRRNTPAVAITPPIRVPFQSVAVGTADYAAGRMIGFDTTNGVLTAISPGMYRVSLSLALGVNREATFEVRSSLALAGPWTTLFVARAVSTTVANSQSCVAVGETLVNFTSPNTLVDVFCSQSFASSPVTIRAVMPTLSIERVG